MRETTRGEDGATAGGSRSAGGSTARSGKAGSRIKNLAADVEVTSRSFVVFGVSFPKVKNKYFLNPRQFAHVSGLVIILDSPVNQFRYTRSASYASKRL